MAEWRTTTKLVDVSQIVDTSTTTDGFTAIKAYKGVEKPFYIGAGSAQTILDTCGYPSSDYPAIQDAINYNKSYGLWLSAPSTGGLHGGCLVTKQGTVSLASGLSSAEINDFSSIVQEEIIGTGDGSTVTFNFTTQLFDYYEDVTIDILVDDVSQTVTATDAEPEVLSTTGGDSGSFTRATGTLAYTFDTAPATDEVIKVQYTIDVSDDCYFALLSNGSQEDDLSVIVSSVGDGEFSLEVYRKDYDDSSTYNEFSESPYDISIVSGTKNGYGQQIYIGDVFDVDDDDNWYIVPILNISTFDTFVDDTDYVDFAGGDRGDEIDGTDLVSGFDYLSDEDAYEDVSIIFDTSAEDSVVTEFETLRGTDSSAGSRSRCKFLVPVTMQSVSTTVGDTDTAKNNVENRGINFVGNSWCRHKDIYNSSPFNCSGMGQIAKRYADSKSVSYGALSPMYIDENGVGGQLGSGIIELVNTATEAQLKSMNSAGIIGIKKISGSGFTIVGDRTSQSTTLSDYSYTIHSDLADYILKTIEDEVLPLQLGKANDTLHRTNVASKAELVMSGVSQYLDDYVVKCDEDNNTDTIRALRKFVLTIGVIFTPNSQQIDFVFVNSRVGTDITQVVNKS